MIMATATTAPTAPTAPMAPTMTTTMVTKTDTTMATKTAMAIDMTTLMAMITTATTAATETTSTATKTTPTAINTTLTPTKTTSTTPNTKMTARMMLDTSLPTGIPPKQFLVMEAAAKTTITGRRSMETESMVMVFTTMGYTTMLVAQLTEIWSTAMRSTKMKRASPTEESTGMELGEMRSTPTNPTAKFTTTMNLRRTVGAT